jgi:kinesin family protein 5
MAETSEGLEFSFDGVFPEGAAQADIFAKVGLPVLQGLMRGLNGAILAYGQTGSGKTYSLLQRGKAAEDAGLLPRLVDSLFVHVAADTQSSYKVEASAMQVYNEQLDDILHPCQQAGKGQCIQVQNGGHIPELTWIECKCTQDLTSAFSRARANLVYAETKMNKASSRSHAIFQIRLTRWSNSQTSTCARLSVVDLAGSERVKKSGVEGSHFKEATTINKSLLALGNVVSALAARKQHVPYRDSKLTRLLEGCLGGNCKTALLVCASPDHEHAQEALCSLEFASRAMDIEVHARVNRVVVAGVENPSAIPEQAAGDPSDMQRRIEEVHGVIAETTLRAEQAAVRAAEAESDVARLESDVASVEIALQEEKKKMIAYAAIMEARLAKEKRLAAETISRLREQVEETSVLNDNLENKLEHCTKELRARSLELERCSSELEELISKLKTRDADAVEMECQLRHEIAELHSMLRSAEENTLAAVTMALTEDQLEAQKDAMSKAQQARKMSDAEDLAKERIRLEAQFKVAAASQQRDFEAKLQAGLENLEARLADAKRRSEAELNRRFALVEEREKDAEKITHLQAQVDSLQRKLQKQDANGRTCSKSESSRSILSSALVSSRCDSAPASPRRKATRENDRSLSVDNDGFRTKRPIPLSVHGAIAERFVTLTPFDSARKLPTLMTKTLAPPALPTRTPSPFNRVR